MRDYHVELIQADSGDAGKLYFGRHAADGHGYLIRDLRGAAETMPEGTGGLASPKPVP